MISTHIIINTETNEHINMSINKQTGEIYKTRACTRNAINSYIKGLKNNNPELYERRLQYSKYYFFKKQNEIKRDDGKIKRI